MTALKKKFLILFLLLGAALSFLVLYFFAPPFMTFDSYHYMQMFIKPISRDSHSFAFGGLLYLFTKFSDLIGQQFFVSLFVIYNCFCLAAVIGFAAYFFVKDLQKNSDISSTAKKILIAAFVFSAFFMTYTNLYFANAIWTELTSLTHVLFFAWLALRFKEKPSWTLVFLSLPAIILAYHTRYLMVVVPVAFGFMGLYDLWDGRKQIKKSLLPACRWFGLAAAMGIAVFASNRTMDALFPMVDGRDYGANYGVQTSMLCTLRCDVDLTEVNCSTEEGKKIITETNCSRIAFGTVKVGAPKIPYLSPLSKVVEEVGIWKTIKWVFLAPFKYLDDSHDVELGLFKFGQDPNPVKMFPEMNTYFKPYFESSILGQEEKKIFISYTHQLYDWFTYKKIFHKLTAWSVLLSLLFILISRNPVVLMLSLYSFGTYLLLAYFNPHVPYRFLMQIITPAFIAIFIYMAKMRLKRNAKV